MRKISDRKKITAIALAALTLSSCGANISSSAVNTSAKTAETSQISEASSVTTVKVTHAFETTEHTVTTEQTTVTETEKTRGSVPTAAETAVPDIEETKTEDVYELVIEDTELTEEPTETADETTEMITTEEETSETAAAVTEDTLQKTVDEETAPETTPEETVPETTAERVTVPTETVMTAAAVQADNYNVIGENNILVSYQNGHYRALMGCFGTYGLCDIWAQGMNTFAAKLPGVNVYSMVVPISSEFYTPESLKEGFTTSQLNKIQYIASYLNGVTNIDAYSELAAHTDEPVYSRTDHHWLPLGAYYAAKAFADKAGAVFPDISEYTPVTRGGYVGSMYTYSKDENLKNDPEDFTMYISPNDASLSTTYYNTSFGGGYASDLFVARNASSYYCSFLGSDDRIAHIKTDAANGRTLVIFKESFGNAIVPFLTSGFENIYVCDIRYFDINAISFCKDVGCTDLLFSVCAMTAAGPNGKYINKIINS